MIRFTLRLTEEEHKKMKKEAEELGISYNKYFQLLLSYQIDGTFKEKYILSGATTSLIKGIDKDITNFTRNLKKINRQFYQDKSVDINEIIDIVSEIKEFVKNARGKKEKIKND